MEQSDLDELLNDPKKLVSKIEEMAPVIPEGAIKFEPEQHKIVTDLQYRPDRKIQTPTGLKDADGEPGFRTTYKPVHRIPSSTQKQIIEWSVNLALGGGVEIDCQPREGIASDETMLAMVKRTLEDNKFDYLAQEIERLKQRYLTVLLVWYAVEAEEGFWTDIAPKSRMKMRCTILSPEDGDTIIPIRDQYKDMIGAARMYVVKIDSKDVKKMDLFLNDKYITYIESEAGWAIEKETPIKYGKANFILDEQKRTEWEDVDRKIMRVEEIDSDTADENQNSAYPILAATGKILDSEGGDGTNTRKTVELEEGADLKYVESEGGHAAAVEERKNLRQDIYVETATPQISLDTASFTGDIPGISIELMFLPSVNKAKGKQQGSIGMFHQRNLNFLKSAMAVINIGVAASKSLVMKPKFKIELPRNLTEEYSNIVNLVGAGLMSKEAAIAQLGFTQDPVAEWERIKAEAAEAQKQALANAQGMASITPAGPAPAPAA